MGRPFIIMLEVVFAMALLAAVWVVFKVTIDLLGTQLKNKTYRFMGKAFGNLDKYQNENGNGGAGKKKPGTVMPLIKTTKWLLN